MVILKRKPKKIILKIVILAHTSNANKITNVEICNPKITSEEICKNLCIKIFILKKGKKIIILTQNYIYLLLI